MPKTIVVETISKLQKVIEKYGINNKRYEVWLGWNKRGKLLDLVPRKNYPFLPEIIIDAKNKELPMFLKELQKLGLSIVGRWS